MTIKHVGQFVLIFVGLAISAIVSAATVYEGERFDVTTGKRSFDIRILIDQQDIRVDVSIGGKAQISMIQTGDRLTLINQGAGVYVTADTSHEGPLASLALTDASWRFTPRRQFALGSYCRVYESGWSAVSSQERCSISFARVLAKNASSDDGTRIGDFLRLVAAMADPTQIYELAKKSMAYSRQESAFPLIIRHFENGRLQAEYRLLRAATDQVSRNAFALPRGLHRVYAGAETTQQASR